MLLKLHHRGRFTTNAYLEGETMEIAKGIDPECFGLSDLAQYIKEDLGYTEIGGVYVKGVSGNWEFVGGSDKSVLNYIERSRGTRKVEFYIDCVINPAIPPLDKLQPHVVMRPRPNFCEVAAKMVGAKRKKLVTIQAVIRDGKRNKVPPTTAKAAELPIEEIRAKRIAENKERFANLNLKKLADGLTAIGGKTIVETTANKEESDEYNPSNEIGQSSEGFDSDEKEKKRMHKDHAISRRTTRSQSSFSNDVVMEKKQGRKKEKSTLPLNNDVEVTNSQRRKITELVVGLDNDKAIERPELDIPVETPIIPIVNPTIPESTIPQPTVPLRKNGNMASYLALREQQKQEKELTKSVEPQPELPNIEDSRVPTDAENIVPTRQIGNMAAYLVLQEQKKKGKEVTNPMRPQLEVPSTEDSPVQTEAESKKRKGRGKTKMDSIHARKERLKIPVNDKFQPVSTDKKLIAQFSLFLGTLGRDYVALNHVSWPKVPDKEAMWTYVKTKYEIDERAKKWVMNAIRDAWKVNKSRIKAEHYTPYDNDEDRMENRPDDVPIEEFVDCLIYWNDPKVQAQAKKNSMNRRKNVNPHTAGSTSFAQVNHEWKIKNGGKEPSLAEMFIVTRKRKKGRKYKSDSSVINYKINTLENLCATAGANSESVEQALMAGESSHGPTWLVGRQVLPKKVKRGDTDANCSSHTQMPTTADELVAMVNQQVKESLVLIVSQIAKDNPGLKVNLDGINNLVGSGTDIDSDDVDSREEGAMQG